MQNDVLIIGGGVIGLSTALRLADDRVSVTVVDRSEAGREASWAGAGMLPPGLPCSEPAAGEPPSGELGTTVDVGHSEYRLRTLSNSLWPELSDRLRQQTGIDNGYRNCGSLELPVPDEDLQRSVDEWTAEGIRVEFLSGRKDLERCVPGLHPDITHAAFLPEFCQTRNPRHLKALKVACQLSGVRIVEHVPDIALYRDGNHVRAAAADRKFPEDKICVTAGAWTRSLLQPLGINLPVRPVRGQIAQLRLPQLPFRCVIEQGNRYLVPREDGLILVGSTEEEAGFEKRTTSSGILGLLEFAASLVPELANAELVRQWAGLRPGSPSGQPFLGRIDDFENLFVGAGHFRSGLQMSPGTAAILSALLRDIEPQTSVTGGG